MREGARKWKGPGNEVRGYLLVGGAWRRGRRVDSPPRVGLYRVILRRYAWYFTVFALCQRSFHILSQHALGAAFVAMYTQSAWDVCICTGQAMSGCGRDERTLRTEELSRDVECLAADNNDLLAAQQLLGNDAGKTAQKVALAVNDDLDDTQKGQQTVLVMLMLVIVIMSIVAQSTQHRVVLFLACVSIDDRPRLMSSLSRWVRACVRVCVYVHVLFAETHRHRVSPTSTVSGRLLLQRS